MSFTLKQLRYFVAVSDAGGLTQAARRLAVSQPSLSAAIAQLEAGFGVQLFLRRRAQGLTLTPAGRRFLGSARGLLERAGALEAEAQGLGAGLDGPLEIGCFVTLAPFFLPRLLGAFAARYPTVELGFREGDIRRLQDELTAGAIELALVYDLDLDERVEAEPMAAVAPHALISAGHRLAAGASVSLAALAEEPMVLLDLPHSREYFQSLFRARGAMPRIRYRTANFEMVRGLVAHGHGFSLLNLKPAVKRSYDGGRLAVLPLADAVPPLPIVLARLRGVRLTARAEAFAESCRAFFAAEQTSRRGLVVPAA